MILNPEKDGVDHINVYSKARTALGLFLSNFTEIDLETDEGDFKSVEAYWYYLSAPDHPQKEKLKELSGFPAKQLGRAIRGKDYNADKDPVFQDKIKKVLRYKIENSQYKTEFAQSSLPFQHYYVYDDKVSAPPEGKWQIEYFEELRKELKQQLPLLYK